MRIIKSSENTNILLTQVVIDLAQTATGMVKNPDGNREISQRVYAQNEVRLSPYARRDRQPLAHLVVIFPPSISGSSAHQPFTILHPPRGTVRLSSGPSISTPGAFASAHPPALAHAPATARTARLLSRAPCFSPGHRASLAVSGRSLAYRRRVPSACPGPGCRCRFRCLRSAAAARQGPASQADCCRQPVCSPARAHAHPASWHGRLHIRGAPIARPDPRAPPRVAHQPPQRRSSSSRVPGVVSWRVTGRRRGGSAGCGPLSASINWPRGRWILGFDRRAHAGLLRFLTREPEARFAPSNPSQSHQARSPSHSAARSVAHADGRTPRISARRIDSPRTRGIDDGRHSSNRSDLSAAEGATTGSG
ncbi:hypothetical protein WOLCODRAFT_165717 [Wolfiporia cocos MD-104 SS10]|uniref:Uncharacterized protein n=1 Tax=Wolfiporia cocos (strain MD-104) TaxID=742152 RepID=A0A2H3JD71_WOLCO|nr:hypothetical protein WOLCODRAFT_165717 [Wolfiporia cocos MD-104 SS10]